MVDLRIREFFEEKQKSFYVNPCRDPQYYKSLMNEVGSSIFTRQILLKIHEKIEYYGYVLISTDLHDYAPPTPTSLSEHYVGPYYGEAILCLVGQTVGELQSFSHQHNGRVFHDVMPIRSYENQQTSGSSEVVLEMHTELAFVDNPPEYLMLFCVRQDREKEAETILYDSRPALNALTPEQCDRLAKHAYQFGLDTNITGNLAEQKNPLPIIDRATSRLLRYDIDLYQSTIRECDEAFEALTQALVKARISLKLKSGQLILIDNKRIVHSRGKFAARYDGGDRWLKRALVRGYPKEQRVL